MMRKGDPRIQRYDDDLTKLLRELRNLEAERVIDHKKIAAYEKALDAFFEAIKLWCQSCHQLCRDCPLAAVRDNPDNEVKK